MSQSEFFDAKEYLTDVAVSDSSSDASETEMEGENEAEEEGSVSEASEMGNEPPHLPGSIPHSLSQSLLSHQTMTHGGINVNQFAGACYQWIHRTMINETRLSQNIGIIWPHCIDKS